MLKYNSSFPIVTTWVIILMILVIVTNAKSQDLKWNDGFLEGTYIDSSSVKGSTFDSLMDCVCLAISRKTIENGTVYASKYCERNGIFARNGIILPAGEMVIYEKFVNVKNGMLYGFKFENGDQKAPFVLHKLLKNKLKHYGKYKSNNVIPSSVIIPNDFIKTNSSLYCKLYRVSSDTIKPKINDWVTVDFRYSINSRGKDSLLSDSKVMTGAPCHIKMVSSDFQGGMDDAFRMLSPGDSAIFIFNTEMFYQNVLKMQVPSEMKDKNNVIYFFVHMISFSSIETLKKMNLYYVKNI